MRSLATIWHTLTAAQRRRFVVLQIVSMLMALSTVIGLAGVMSFLALLAEPSLVEAHPALKWLWEALPFTTRREFLLALGGGFIVLLACGAIVNVLGARAMGRFAYAVGDRIREVLFAQYLRRDYLFHARADAAHLMNNVLNQADRATLTMLNGQLLITNAVLTLLVVVSIAVVNLAVALVGALAIAASYWLFFRLIRRRIGRNGQLQSTFGAERIAVVEQAFGGIKYLLVAGAQSSFNRRFAAVTRRFSRPLADNQFIGQFPKYVLECMAGTALIACAAFVSGGAAGAAWFAQLSFIGFAGFRLLPAIQQIYHAFVVVRANRGAIEAIAAELDAAALARADADGVPSPDALPLSGSVELVDVSFGYAADAPLAVKNVSLRIPAGAAIGIGGASGCGKTTLLDLMLGLLVPVAGRVEVGCKPLDPQGLRAWRQSIGYVPQDITFMDASVRENIAFGIEPDDIDDALVRDAAQRAGADRFIEALPGGYGTRMPAVGGGLSGGQRQRIGIARALYRRPSVLVLDEATNALDAETERAVIDAVVRNRGTRTVILVAHSAAALDACDRAYEMRDGQLLDRGPAAQSRMPELSRA